MKKIHRWIYTLLTAGGFGLTAFPALARAAGEQSEQIFSPISTAKQLIDLLVEATVKYSFQVFGGIVVLVIGWMVARFAARVFHQFLEKHHVDVTVSKFLIYGLKLIIFIFSGIIALGKFGIEIAPFIAGLSVIGVGTSLALQGVLSNYAAGITLIFTKPFKVGDIIEVAGEMGEVEDMTLPRTILKTVDDTIIVIPNKHIIGEIIHNFSAFKRLDIKVGISYNTDIIKSQQVLKETIKSDPRIIATNKTVKVGIEQFGDSSINLYARLWCKQSDYWDLLFEINNKIYLEFQKHKIEIPFPQRVVHLRKEETI